MTDQFFKDHPQWQAFGLSDGGLCASATHFAPNHIVGARHCLHDGAVPGDITFWPAFVGPWTQENRDQRPSIRGRRIVRGTGNVGHINDGGTTVWGNDWVVVELDPATYVRGTPLPGSGIPNFPTTFANWPTIRSPRYQADPPARV